MKKRGIFFVLRSLNRIFVAKNSYSQMRTKRILKVIAACLGVLLLLMVSAVALVNTDYVQDRVVPRVVTALSEKLQTRVSLGRLNFDLFRQDVCLHDLYIEDREQRPLLRVELLAADVDLLALMRRELRIPEVRVEGVKAELHKAPDDSVANYQFIVDAFKSQGKKDEAETKHKKKQALAFDIYRFSVEDVEVNFNERTFSLGALRCVREVPDSVSEPVRHVVVEDFYFKNVHNRPRKNVGKPNRGYFDPQYLEVTAGLKLDIDYLHKDSLHAVLHDCVVTDTITGIDIRELSTAIAATPKAMVLQDLLVRLQQTTVHIDSCELQLPDKKTGRPFAYHTTWIYGEAILQDIARPFAPPLKNFTMPVQFRTRMYGDVDSLAFTNVEVYTADKQLKVASRGIIRNLKDKYALHVHFDVPRMKVTSRKAEAIIRQFPIKRFLMEQLDELEYVTYRGGFDVFYKREVFSGVVGTKVGALIVDLTVDGQKYYLTGHVGTQHFKIGKVVDMERLGDVSMTADFKFDISRKRTAVMRHRKGGRLPMGEVSAHVTEASYFVAKTTNLQAHIVSDGALAEGKLMMPGGHMDLFCTFSFTNTQELKKMKIKPGVKFHGLSFERKEKKKAEKEAAKKEAERKRKAKKAK